MTRIRLALMLAVATLGISSVWCPDPVSAQASAAADTQARTQKIVVAANAFAATLTPAQKKALQFAFTDGAQRARWSNLPNGAVRRAGVRWGDMTAPQRTALMDLLGTVLSPQGMTMVRQEMDADELLAGGGGRGMFGSDYYFVAFLGAPSTTTPWMLQFGGHHLALNATFKGGALTLSPSLTGGQPVKYVKDGKPVFIVETEVRQSMAMLGALTPDQRRKAVISTQPIDLVLGPGHDFQTLQPEGLEASEMSEAQKTQLLAVVQARLGIINPDHLAATMAEVRKNLNHTRFAWFGSTTEPGAAYVRVTGPTIVMEYAPQSWDAGGHLHSMYRDPTNQYGSAWTSLN